MSNVESEALIPLADTAAVGLGVGRRSIGRIVKNPPDGFPVVLRIKGRLYVQRSELDAYKARLIANAIAAPRIANEPRAA
jgi:hypothetical protein